jgi:hypothetical protein
VCKPSSLMFANADYVKSETEALCTDEIKVVVLDAETSPNVDVSAATMLVELRSALRRGTESSASPQISGSSVTPWSEPATPQPYKLTTVSTTR